MQPKVFISYSWSNSRHEEWVVSLSQRLMNNGVEVVLDKWDLKEGHNKYVFMESMVNSESITKVLMILDKKYTEKANERGGGVGTETQIISPNIYANTAQEKFIPVVSEVDGNGDAFIPHYLKGTIYIDLSQEEHFEENYEKLLRSILNRPIFIKPKLGTIPSYIIEDTPMNFKTSAILRGFDSQVDRHPNRINAIIRDFFNEFFENLKDFRITTITNVYLEAGKVIFENLTQYIPLRDDYIAFISKLSKGIEKWDLDILVRLFEKLPLLLRPEEQIGSWYDLQFDNFRFVMHELFIYTIAVFLKNDQYDILDHLFNTKYFLKDSYQSKVEASTYSSFHHNVDSIKAYYEQLQGRNFFNVQADMFVKRIPANFSKADFVNGDLLCYYVGLFTGSHWFPTTYVYQDGYNLSIDFFNRLVSKKHFEKIKSILLVETIEELKIKLENIKEEDKGNMRYSNSWSRVSPLESFIKSDLIGTSR